MSHLVYNPALLPGPAEARVGRARVRQGKNTLRAELEERLQFEALLSEISACFVNLSIGEVDAAIEDAQRLICERLDLDRSSLWQFLPQNPDVMLMTHLYEREGCQTILEKPEYRTSRFAEWLYQYGDARPVYLRIEAKSFYPRILQKLAETRVLAIPDVADLPDEFAQDRPNLERFGTRSTVIVGMDLGAGFSGCLTFASVRRKREWPEELVHRFRVVADLFANVLARRRTEEVLRESEYRLNLIIESARAGLWSMDIATSAVWVNPSLREIFHFAPDQEIRYQSFLDVIHPEDKDRIHQIVQDAVKSGENFQGEYRILTPDGDTRWILFRGRKRHSIGKEGDCLMGVSFDVTDRKRNEEALQKSYAEIKALKDRL